MFEQARDVFVAGGWVMWPLAVLSVLSVALSLERALFWWGTKPRGRGGRGGRNAEGGRGGVGGLLSADRLSEARAVAREDGTVYGQFVLAMLADASADRADDGGGKEPQAGTAEGSRLTAGGSRLVAGDRAPSAVSRPPRGGGGGAGAVEEVRPAIERWAVTMSTIITAAPMLGILGTVLGIIKSFQLLGEAGGGGGAVTDPTQVAGGIAEALLTTAFGLIVALITLFPYNVFRAAADRCFGRLETLAESAERRGDAGG